jgi:hypothetical protein
MLLIIVEKGGNMSGGKNITSTRTAGWQEVCRTWANAGKSFEVNRIEMEHFAFCKALCKEFDYECLYQFHNEHSIARFRPGAS